MIVWNNCTQCGQSVGVIHSNGEAFCSTSCQQQWRAEDRAARREARDRMEAARDRRAQISLTTSCALICVMISWCLLGGYEQAELASARARSGQWAGPRLQAQMAQSERNALLINGGQR